MASGEAYKWFVLPRCESNNESKLFLRRCGGENTLKV